MFTVSHYGEQAVSFKMVDLPKSLTVSGKIASEVTVRGDSGVAGEGRVVSVPKVHSWVKCTMPLTNINSDCMSNAFSGLYIIYIIYISSKVTAPQDAHKQ